MRSFILAAASIVACTASAVPADLRTRGGACLTNDEAYQVAGAFQDLISLPFNQTLAIAAFVPGFVDYSDSVNELINNGCPSGPAPLTSPTFASRAEFIAGQSGQAPIPFEILNLWNNCAEITIRWRSSDPANGLVTPVQPVTGIIAIEVVANPGGEFPFQIKTVYSEFNSGAWLYDLVCISKHSHKLSHNANNWNRASSFLNARKHGSSGILDVV